MIEFNREGTPKRGLIKSALQRLGFVGILLSCLILSACSQPSLPILKEGDVILAFGDSLTLGYGVKTELSYPAVLQKLSGHKVINAGISGETTAEGLERISNVLDKHQPALLILLEGGNDVLRKVPEAMIQQNLARMIELTQSRGIPILLVAVPPKKLFSSSLELYAELSEIYQIPLEDDSVASLVMRPSMKSDYIHFNEKGYQVLAEDIYKKLQSAGAL